MRAKQFIIETITEDSLPGTSIANMDFMLKQGVAEGKQPGQPVVDAILKAMPIAQEIWFHGSRAIGKHRKNSDTDILVVVPDDLVGDQYLGVVRILQKLSTHFDNHDIQPTKAGTNIHRIAQEEGRLLWSNKQGVAEGSDRIAKVEGMLVSAWDYLQSQKAQGINPQVDETAAWRRKEGKSKSGGLNAKGVASYRRENPGSKLQTAVTTKPSKLKPGSKAAKRRKSFCARMGGMKGPMKKPNGKPTRKALALRKWNCESVEQMVDMILENMDHAKDNQAVPELKAALLAKKSTLQQASEDDVYDIIDTIMTRIAKSHGMSGQKLHSMWVKEYDQIPDTWIMK